MKNERAERDLQEITRRKQHRKSELEEEERRRYEIAEKKRLETYSDGYFIESQMTSNKDMKMSAEEFEDNFM